MLVAGLELSDQEKILAVKTEVQSKMLSDQEQLNEEDAKNSVMNSLWKTIDGQMKHEQLLAFLTEQKTKINFFESLVVDIISIIDIEIAAAADSGSMLSSSDSTSTTKASDKKEKFYLIVNQLRPFLGDDLLKERLEVETLESLKLVAKKETFNQKYIKIKTRLFYKQQKFNLLREETEGYSKLITELGQSNLNGKILEKIQSLIGCFNLDPNRVLDIVLESFENTPTLHRTFIPLLQKYKADNETICQIIGFKFQALNQQEAKLQSQAHKEETNSKSNIDQQTQQDFDFFQQQHIHFKNSLLYTATAYLLKYNMIDLDLLMPHMYPSDVEQTKFYKEEFELARQYAKKLTMVNLSETPSSADPKSRSSSSNEYSPIDYAQQHQQNQQEELKRLMHTQLNKLENQRVSMVKALVEIEDYKTALRMIEKVPHWYLATYPDISLEICWAIDQNIVDPIYKRCNCLSKYCKEKYINSKSKSTKMSDSDIDKSNLDGMLGTFVEDILPILSAMGPGIANDPILFTKLIRICVAFIDNHNLSITNSSSGSSSSSSSANTNEKEQSPQPSASGTSTPNTLTRDNSPKKKEASTVDVIATLTANELAFYNQIYTLLNDVLMPSLSMISMNPSLAIELWNLLKLFPYEMRYFLYNNWRQLSYKHFPQLIRTKAECTEKIKYLLKRLTKENVRIHGRQIGKLSHNNPIIVCDFILTQIQRYDNFILPIVDSLKFLTPLSYDVLSYCTIVAISDADKDKMKYDSTSVSTWLKSVATFCALSFKKYPIELTAIIQYVINQLKNRKSFDLLILQEIVQKMCGIEVLSEVNDLQLEAMAGGDILRQEAGYFNPIRNIKKCANRLKEALADHGLILPLCILLSQQRDYIVYQDQAERENHSISSDKQHLKLTGSLYDQCQDSLVQFSQFLSNTLTTEEYIHIFPKIDELVSDYHMSADVAFFLSRPMYSHHINSKYDELRKLDRNFKNHADKPSKTQRYLESIDCVMQPVIEVVKTLHSPKIWEDMSPLFYTTFWTLSMNDCFVPTGAYDKQKASLKQKLNALEDNMELTTNKKKKEKEKLLIMVDKLNEEESKQRDHVQHVKARFEKEKEFWFPHKNKTKNETITVFLQLCIFSRCLFTQIDAYYCAKFIQIIHSLKTPNFSTIICYDRIFSDISYSIASLTDNEARKYGRFLLGLLETVMSWHADPAIFEAECASFPGFLTIFRNALNSNSSAAANKQEPLDYENFRHVCHKWHYKLTKSFIVCLESEEYLQMRNSLIILTKVIPHYPRLTGFCSALEKRVEKIKINEKDRKQDISTLAMVYLGQLKARKSQMVDESKFHLKEITNPAKSDSSSTSRSSSSKSESKQSSVRADFKQPSNPDSATTQSSKQDNNQKQPSQLSSSKSGSPTTTASEQSSSKPVNGKATARSRPSSSTTNGSTGTNGSTSTKESSQSASNTNSITSSPPAVSNGSSSKSSSRDPESSRHSRNTEDSRRESTRSTTNNSQESTTANSVSKSFSSSSSKHRSQSSTTQSPSTTDASRTQPSTPTRGGTKKANEFSPTSSVSSDEWPTQSPKRAPTNANHSRSSSPKGTTATGSSSSSSRQSESLSSRHNSENKSKRLKSDDSLTNASKSGSAAMYEKGNANGAYDSSTSSNSSSKRKSSRDRNADNRGDRSERTDKEKKDHRKREHSNDEVVDGERKRSKSDENKSKDKKSSSSLVSQNFNHFSSSSSSKRSSKKHDSSNSNLKDDSGVMNNSRDSPSIVGSNSSYKYREDNNNPRRNDDYKNKGYRNNNF